MSGEVWGWADDTKTVWAPRPWNQEEMAELHKKLGLVAPTKVQHTEYIETSRRFARRTAELEARWPNPIIKLEHECEIAGHEIDCPVCSRVA